MSKSAKNRSTANLSAISAAKQSHPHRCQTKDQESQFWLEAISPAHDVLSTAKCHFLFDRRPSRERNGGARCRWCMCFVILNTLAGLSS
jgi:hypothetical protein